MHLIEGISIIEAKKLITIIKEKYEYDFSGYSMPSFKRRVAIATKNLNIFSIDILIDKLLSENYFFDLFLKEISPATSEMFRDPTAWRFLSDIILPKISNNLEQIQIWIPECTSGEEIYSTCILLKEAGLYHKSKIYAHFNSTSMINTFKNSGYDLKKMELNKANYQRFNENGDFNKYYSIINYKALFKPSLIENVIIEKYFISPLFVPAKIDLIIYRNKLIYYNSSHQDEIFSIISTCLDIGGYIFIGSKEKINQKNKFKIVSELERIYKKTSKS